MIRLLLSVVLVLLPMAGAAAAEPYRCGGDPLFAQVFNGAVDATGIPNSSSGTVPGAFVTLRWRDLSLQLPRTNTAGAPSFSDGIWWWSLEEPAQPEFRHRLGRGQSETITCTRQPISPERQLTDAS